MGILQSMTATARMHGVAPAIRAAASWLGRAGGRGGTGPHVLVEPHFAELRLDAPWSTACDQDDDGFAVPAEEEDHEDAFAFADHGHRRFVVCEKQGDSDDGPVFGRPFRSDDGDFAVDGEGYLLNGSGEYLMGIGLDEGGLMRHGAVPEVVHIGKAVLCAAATTTIRYRVNLPAYPMTAMVDTEEGGSDLLERRLFTRDPSAHGSGVVLADDLAKFMDRSLAGGSVVAHTADGVAVRIALRWAKLGNVRSCGREWWNLFYQAWSDARGSEVAWRNAGQDYVFGADGRLDPAINRFILYDLAIDGHRLGNIVVEHGVRGVTQFADSSGVVKVSVLGADGAAGGELTGVSITDGDRVVARYSNQRSVCVADIGLLAEMVDWLGADEARSAPLLAQ